MLAALALAQPWAASAQDRFEFGVRYWLSKGETQFSHNAQVADPTAGNPTSILTYEDRDAHSLELHARGELDEGWFIKGNFGIGSVREGSFDDEDYNVGQVKFSDTTSTVRGERLSYFTLDVGREIWRSAAGGTTLGAFAGFQQWSEHLDAFGALATVGPISVPDDVIVISNEVRWRSFRLGLAAKAQLFSATSIAVELAYIPHSVLRNEDSHYLRTDLGPTPNIITTGTGNGVQLDIELRHAFHKRIEAGIGVRHWHLRSTDADVSIAGFSLPVNELETRRTGVTASLTGRW